MKVKEVIELLEKVKDKEMSCYIDCSHCGKALEIASLGQVVVFKTVCKKYLI